MRATPAVLTGVLLAVAALLAAPLPASAIVGGRDAPAPYSFMGSLQRLDAPRDDLHACGATLIAPTWALTAGHCARSAADVIDQPTTGTPVGWQVRFGSTRVDSGGQLVDVAQFVQLNNRYFDRDLALLRLAEPVQGAPVRIADATPPAGTPARIMGWGQTCADAEDPACLPQQLQEADTEVQPAATCDGSDTLLCVGARDGSAGPANMDSGGPALVEEDGEWTLVGGVEGAGEGAPGVYTDVTAFRGWIDGHVSGRVPVPADTPFPSDALAGAVSLGGCSGTLFTATSSRPSDPAMVLTNGHCVEPRPGPGEALVDRPGGQLALVRGSNGETVARARTAALVYATITGTDLAVHRLDASYAQLAADGVTARPLATTGPQPGQQVQVLSATSGRDFTCTVQAVVPQLREAGYTQQQALRYASQPGCGPQDGDGPGPGDSGSPLVDPGTGRIVGVHATGDDGGEECAEGSPCEVGADGDPTSVAGHRYAQQTAPLDACLAPGSVLDLAATGCTLTLTGWGTAPPDAAPPAPRDLLVAGVVVAPVAALTLVAVRRRRSRATASPTTRSTRRRVRA